MQSDLKEIISQFGTFRKQSPTTNMELINENSYNCVKHTQYLVLYNKYADFVLRLNDRQRDIWRESHLIFINGLLKAAKDNPGKSILHLYDKVDSDNYPGTVFQPSHPKRPMLESLFYVLKNKMQIENDRNNVRFVIHHPLYDIVTGLEYFPICDDFFKNPQVYQTLETLLIESLLTLIDKT